MHGYFYFIMIMDSWCIQSYLHDKIFCTMVIVYNPKEVHGPNDKVAPTVIWPYPLSFELMLINVWKRRYMGQVQIVATKVDLQPCT